MKRRAFLSIRVPGTLTMPRSVLAAAGERPRARRPAPLLGQHTQEVLAALHKETPCPSL